MKSSQELTQRKHAKPYSSLQNSLAYGGQLLTTRRGRQAGRPLATRHTMHLVLRSSLAVNMWSFRKPKNLQRANFILQKFSTKYGVKILSVGNGGNHLHIHMQLSNRPNYPRFIRAVTSAITIAITGWSRWSPRPKNLKRFWDRRPFTRIVIGLRDFLNVRDYLRVNALEAKGYSRFTAKYIIQRNWWLLPQFKDPWTS